MAEDIANRCVPDLVPCPCCPAPLLHLPRPGVVRRSTATLHVPCPAATRQVSESTATMSSVATGDVPSMRIQFTPLHAMASGGTVMLAVASTTPTFGVQVFANATPAPATVVVVGLASCAGATGAIDTANQRLTITLPSACALAANVSVTVEVPSGFFAPNPAVGTTVVLSLWTSSDPEPRTASTYTVGMGRCWAGSCPHLFPSSLGLPSLFLGRENRPNFRVGDFRLYSERQAQKAAHKVIRNRNKWLHCIPG